MREYPSAHHHSYAAQSLAEEDNKCMQLDWLELNPQLAAYSCFKQVWPSVKSYAAPCRSGLVSNGTRRISDCLPATAASAGSASCCCGSPRNSSQLLFLLLLLYRPSRGDLSGRSHLPGQLLARRSGHTSKVHLEPSLNSKLLGSCRSDPGGSCKQKAKPASSSPK